MKKPIKIIDLFAGPGGLGEGFSALQIEGQPAFKIGVSVEKETSAHKTLTLRAFFRQFPAGHAPDAYYQYLRGEVSKQELFAAWPEQAKAAHHETLDTPRALGEDNTLIDLAIGEALKGERNWVLIGGPPCQAYSLVGRARNKGIVGYKAEDDHRHFLYKEYLRIIAKYQPAIFVMENVKGMLSAKVGNKPIFNSIKEDLQNPSVPIYGKTNGPQYRIYSLSTLPTNDLFQPELEPGDFVIRSEKFGIPQTRHRVILIGLREDIPTERFSILKEQTPPTLKQMIGAMPKLRSGLSRQEDSKKLWIQTIEDVHETLDDTLKQRSDSEPILKKLSTAKEKFNPPNADRGSRFLRYRKNANPFAHMPIEFADWFHDDRLLGYTNHQSRGHMVKDLERYLFCAAFSQSQVNGDEHKNPRLNDFPQNLLPNHANIKSGKFVDRFKVQLPDKPASTITSHISKDGHYFIHYDLNQCRSLTVREAARIQTFPDNYFFEGNRTQQYVQVGNAVPPLLARKIADIVSKMIA